MKVSVKTKASSRTTKLATMAVNENKDFMALSVVDDPRDAPGRPRLSMLFDLAVARQPTRSALRDDSLVDQLMEDANRESQGRAAH